MTARTDTKTSPPKILSVLLWKYYMIPDISYSVLFFYCDYSWCFLKLHIYYFYSSKEQHDTLPIRLLLDDIHDPMNFGAILRCAYYLGIDKIIAGRNKYVHSCLYISILVDTILLLMCVQRSEHLLN